jgi:hypothetical protein
MNEFSITIKGKTNIEDSLDDTKEYSVAFERLACEGIAKTPNEDGTYSYNYKLKSTGVVTVITGDKIIRGKAKGSKAQAYRRKLYILYEQGYSAEYKDFEDFYSNWMDNKITELDNLLI